MVLIKSVLNSLPLYYFSLFRAPPCVLKILESVRREFFWGGSESSKIPWVKWDKVVSSYEFGGLNFGLLKSKNLALLGKWWWRFYTETDSLWVTIIRSIYGPRGGLDLESEAIRSLKPSTWKNIILTGTLLEDIGINFKASFATTTSSISTKSFWNSLWIGEQQLKVQFSRLYRLDSDPDARICDRIELKIDGSAALRADWCRSP
ncbi:uncharacterized mitochondrial protein AtMg00310-like [Rutidosis leptorrhynchoides]|uniref:uncharacterized mitochondrial protein AtMg00310-like n=1 Tax=Rutidosis leptorrhynchoides TaxID=125765 RepID=UPI003A995DA6